MSRPSDITTLTDLHLRLPEYLSRVKETGRPLYVTTNGKPEVVLLSPEIFDRLLDELEHARSLASLDRGTADVKAGRVKPFREAIYEIANDIGVDLDQ